MRLKILRAANAGHEEEYPVLAVCLIAASAAYVILSLKDFGAASRTMEASLLLALCGAALLFTRGFYFMTGVGSALAALIVAAALNEGALSYFGSSLTVAEKTAINLITVFSGILISLRCFCIAVALPCFLGWAAAAHFLLLAILQKDQLGTGFDPYEFQNPIQWLPSGVFAALTIRGLVQSRLGGAPSCSSKEPA